MPRFRKLKGRRVPRSKWFIDLPGGYWWVGREVVPPGDTQRFYGRHLCSFREFSDAARARRRFATCPPGAELVCRFRKGGAWIEKAWVMP
jgi:hypothetical protein